jgi:FMN-dependent NADH-azoreductase
MAKVLYIASNPKPIDKSVSLKLGREFLEEYKKENPEDEVIEIDLYKTEIPELDNEVLNVHNGILISNPAALEKLSQISYFTDQFVEADKYIFVTPLWNLGLPAKMKTYIDTIAIAGKTFKYTPSGVQGLLKNKKCLHIHSSGGFHSKDPQSHADGYLKDIMSFLGVQDYKSIVVEGHQAAPHRAQEIIDSAKARIPEFVNWLS